MHALLGGKVHGKNEITLTCDILHNEIVLNNKITLYEMSSNENR